MIDGSKETSLGALIDENSLDSQTSEWERNRVQYTLDACLSEVKDRSKDIEGIFDENKKLAAIKLVQKLVSREIYESSKDRLRVPEYVQKAKALQSIYSYLGTHWKLVPVQVFYDFCKAGAKKMGLSDEYAEDPNFMCDVFEQVAFQAARYTKTFQPVGGVWINLRNCTVEINRDGSISTHAHRPEDFFLYCLPYCYDPSAGCPKWHQFLDEVLPDKTTQTLLGEFIGYCFTKNLKLEKMAVFYGSGANGKSVIMEVLKNLFGSDNVSESTLSSVTTDPEARAQLEGKLVNISSESNRTIDSSILKMMVSGEAVEIRILYKGTRYMTDPPKLITSYNELPPMENTYGYRRRWLLFPFDKTIAEDKQDPALARKLCTELSGILNWVLGLLAQLLQRVAKNEGEGFTSSEECNKALSSYAMNSNSVMMFLEECCQKNSETTVKAKEAYTKYCAYCTASGIKKPFTQKNFKKFAHEWGAEETVYQSIHYLNIYIDTSSYE